MGIPWQQKARARMKELGVRQKDIVDALGVSKGTVSSWLSGRYPPRMQQLDRIAKMLKMSLSDLLADDDALARNAVELSTLKKIREIPADKLPQAEALIAAVLDTLATPESDDD